MKDIMLKITGKTVSVLPKPDDKEKDNTIEFVTSGKYASRGGITRISYDETELSGMEGVKTQITISGEKLKMQRISPNAQDTIMEFEKGKRYEGLYATPYGNIGMEILTNDIEFKGDDKIKIDYSLSLKGLIESRNELDIEVIQ